MVRFIVESDIFQVDGIQWDMDCEDLLRWRRDLVIEFLTELEL